MNRPLEIHIDELVVSGLDARVADRLAEAIGEAVRRELAGEGRGLPDRPLRFEHLDAGQFPWQHQRGPMEAANRIGQAIAQSLQP